VVFYFCQILGNGEGWSGQRYGNYMQFDSSKGFIEDAGYEVINHYYRPIDKPIDVQLWLAIVAIKPDCP